MLYLFYADYCDLHHRPCYAEDDDTLFLLTVILMSPLSNNRPLQ